MPLPQPLDQANSLRSQVNEFIENVTQVGQFNEFVFKRLMDDAERLQGVGGNVVDGSLLRATLYSAAGKLDDAERMLRNVEANNSANHARMGRLSYLVNHGYASRALALVEDALRDRGGRPFAEICGGAIAAGGLHRIVEAANNSKSNGEVLIMTGVLELAKKAAAVMTDLGVSDEHFAAMLDVAGQSLRDHNFYWQRAQPDLRVLAAQEGGPAVLFEYRIYTTPQKAAEMTWALTEAIMAKNLDRQGIFLGFLGTKLAVRLAA